MPSPYPQFFLFGDSITQNSFDQNLGFGFSAALQDAYIRKLDVVNRGFSGYNTRQALQVLPSIVPSPEQATIRFLTVFFGANDCSLPDAPNKQHVPLEEYQANLEKIITHPLIQAHNPRILLIAPPPINEHLWWPRDQSNGYTSVSRVASITKDYADAACKVGAKLEVPVVNLWKAFMERANFKSDAWKLGDPLPGSLDIPQNDALVALMYDGLHFQPEGYVILFQEVMKTIAEQWPDQMPEKLSTVFPGWNDEDEWKVWESNQALSQ
ncbi:SGNH hydrolase [Cucurbitaria berberidis CBS 394.84]|uniref:SGNH hydrolase n=1 Tax=Cucurbitaria berberidis CBS 394.84 TaxID=1168544 RepID=A0A9P4GMA1_9PLEO|nr:SGNH hydrolase [Cucurbitaria berberidis CBS 394.84]KAF1847661.1 SGNH hydrolase [Cucurbitaria berberidis CBS 394.84]